MKYHAFVFYILRSYTSRIFVTNSDRKPLNFFLSPHGFVLYYFLQSLALLLVTAGQNHTKRINKLSLLECFEEGICPNWQDPKSKVRRVWYNLMKKEFRFLPVCYKPFLESGRKIICGQEGKSDISHRWNINVRKEVLCKWTADFPTWVPSKCANLQFWNCSEIRRLRDLHIQGHFLE